MVTAALIRKQIESRIPAAFGFYQRRMRETIPTGIGELDAVVGGVPRRGLSQLCGPPSSGRTTLLMSLLASAIREGECCALVDATDSFDPCSAENCGVQLSRLLWLRCGGESKNAAKLKHTKPELKPVEQAFATADLLLQGGGFGLVVVDLASIHPRLISKVPLSTWFRFSRAVEDKPTALVFLLDEPCGASYAGLVLRLLASPKWSGNDVRQHCFFLQQLKIEIAVQRCEDRKPPQPVKPQFIASRRWG